MESGWAWAVMDDVEGFVYHVMYAGIIKEDKPDWTVQKQPNAIYLP